MYLQIYKLFPCIYILFFFFRKRGKGISREYYFIRKFFFQRTPICRKSKRRVYSSSNWITRRKRGLNFAEKEYVRNVNINVVYTEWKRRRIEHSRSNVRHARGVEWLLACRDPAKTGREFEARRGNKVEGETFRTNTDPIERGQDPVRPRHFNPCIGACNLESVLPYLVLDWLTLENSATIRWENFDDNLISNL